MYGNFFLAPTVPQPVLLRKASVLTTSLRNACLAVNAHVFGILIKMITSQLVAVPFYNLTVVGNANGKFILTPTICIPILELVTLSNYYC